MSTTDSTAPSALHLSHSLSTEIVGHLCSALPLEAVGILATLVDGGVERAMAFYPGTNVDVSATRYTMEPAEVLAAFDDMARRNWRFGAIVHSHPASSPAPSATDLREAYYPDVLMVIVGLSGATAELRAWSVRTTEPREVPVVIGRSLGETAVEAPGRNGA